MRKTLREIFIENLRYYRQKKGLSQLELAVEIEKSPNYINGIENNSTFPSVETIEQIANVLSISAKLLFDENGCIENILPSEKKQFIDDVAKRLSSSLEKNIRHEMEDVLGK
jgi:transcriptional regulator with XRE-family HTH domain